ncbi:hypothetical protein CKAN_01451600 [Cinnamomum micranthum f. kanehirae]|uniref:Uncharacterized protein n=1 Tax=Cinnamomum micranthum f. kanehirae TaxID=337451 RepID=A0A3S3MZX8_9MAGN|nr:hypothetical protein CKAN_01451600 [Cinnamomum micranthum f. kanehirae]
MVSRVLLTKKKVIKEILTNLHLDHEKPLICMFMQVQHLIETCLILGMSRADCVEALAEHAHIRPLITLTVWRELLKENRGFFQSLLSSYFSKASHL